MTPRRVAARSSRLCSAVLLFALLCVSQTIDTCRELRHRGRLAETEACFTKLRADPQPAARAEACWGLGRYQEANEHFRKAAQSQPGNAAVRVRWGRLFLERGQRADASKLFQEALEIDKENPEALLGMALAAAGGFESRAVEFARKAVAKDQSLYEARELLARMALEDGDTARAIEEADKALSIQPEALDAMAVRATIDWLAGRQDTPWAGRILKVNPSYGEAYTLAGHFFVLNRRYEEGIQLYRKAMELNPKLLTARAELGVNLMRLGQDEEARWQLEYCYTNGDRYPAVVNTLRLLDSYKNFVVHKDGNLILKLHQRDDALLRPYFETELERAIAAYEKKYKFKLERPVQVEAYPDHEDFAVRTLGMPGLGAQGVTFGYVVAMDSPSARKPGTFHWASTLWHELSHVYVLAATKHRAPRWFAEGMAVYEETAVAPDWGDRLSPDVILAVRKKKLLPVAELDRGFVRPTYPAQVVVSYFQAGRICSYIASRWGYQMLLDMMHAFGDRKDTPEVIREQLRMEPAAFDTRFLEWLEAGARRTLDGYEEWEAGRKRLRELMGRGAHDDVIGEAPALRDLYPDYVENNSVYELLAQAYLAAGRKQEAAAELQRYARAGGHNPETIKRLARLLAELGRDQEATEALDRLNYVYPRDEELHRRLGDLWLALGRAPDAVREFEALLAMKPLDRAATHFSLARAYRGANRLDDAREQVLLALEAAPGYRPAQKLLLELNP